MSLMNQLWQQFGHAFFQFFTWLKFHNRALWNDHFLFRAIWITSDFSSGFFDTEGAKVPDDHLIILSKAAGDVLNGVLNDIKDLLLG